VPYPHSVLTHDRPQREFAPASRSRQKPSFRIVPSPDIQSTTFQSSFRIRVLFQCSPHLTRVRVSAQQHKCLVDGDLLPGGEHGFAFALKTSSVINALQEALLHDVSASSHSDCGSCASQSKKKSSPVPVRHVAAQARSVSSFRSRQQPSLHLR